MSAVEIVLSGANFGETGDANCFNATQACKCGEHLYLYIIHVLVVLKHLVFIRHHYAPTLSDL